MNEGLSVKLPLARDKKDGYVTNKTYENVVNQNLKNLILTSPGERIMDPDFGVGLRRHVFELAEQGFQSTLARKIYDQVEEYMPFIEIQDLEIIQNEEVENQVNITLYYLIEPLQKSETLDISFLL